MNFGGTLTFNLLQAYWLFWGEGTWKIAHNIGALCSFYLKEDHKISNGKDTLPKENYPQRLRVSTKTDQYTQIE